MKFEYYKSGFIRKSWKWRLVASNGRIMASGSGFNTKQNCVGSILAICNFFRNTINKGESFTIDEV